MARVSQMLPSKCCCCSLRAGSIVVGSFSLIIALIFMGLAAVASVNLRGWCYNSYSDEEWKLICYNKSETGAMVANLMTILALLNAAEFVTSVGLIWGASKRIVPWVTTWLLFTGCWILLHSMTGVIYIFATQAIELGILTGVLGLIILAMSLLCFLTVFSFRQELIKPEHHPSEGNILCHPSDGDIMCPNLAVPPTAPVASGYRPLWSPQQQSTADIHAQT